MPALCVIGCLDRTGPPWCPLMLAAGAARAFLARRCQWCNLAGHLALRLRLSRPDRRPPACWSCQATCLSRSCSAHCSRCLRGARRFMVLLDNRLFMVLFENMFVDPALGRRPMLFGPKVHDLFGGGGSCGRRIESGRMAWISVAVWWSSMCA